MLVPIYGCRITVIASPDTGVLEKACGNAWDKSWLGLAASHGQDSYRILFRTGKTGNVTMPVFVHELSHVTDMICEAYGIQGTEPRAYLMQWLCGACAHMLKRSGYGIA